MASSKWQVAESGGARGRAPAAVGAARSRLALDVLVLIGCLAVYALVAWQMSPFVPDDSYISFRYAENLAVGEGLTFNPGDTPVEGYSNFLWIVLLAGAARLGLELTPASVLLGTALGALTLGMLWQLLRRRGRTGWALAVPVGLLALSGPFVLYAISGMETALYGALLMALLLAVDGLFARPGVGRGLALGATALLLALTRPEGVVALPVVVACIVVFERRAERERRRSLLLALAAAGLLWLAALVAYHAARVMFFDALLPTPFISKGVSGSFVDLWLINLRYFFVRQTHYYTPLGYYYLAIGAPALLALLLVRRNLTAHRTEVTALVVALAYASIYVNFTDWMPGMRYYAPLVGLLLVPFSLLADEWRAPAAGRGADVPFLTLGLTLAFLSAFTLAILRLDGQQLQAATQESLVALGRWLDGAVPDDTLLAMGDVGATPYYAGLRTIDINPDSLTDRHIAEQGWSSDYFFAVDPDVVILTAFSLTEPDFTSVHETLYALPRFQSTYERIGVTRNDWYQDRSYWVFFRRGLSPAPEQLATFPTGIHK